MALYILSVLPIFLQLWIASRMVKLGQHRQYPAFFAYVCFQAGRVALQDVLALWPKSQAYFYAYYGLGFLSIFFQLPVFREVFVHILKDYSNLSRFRRRGYEIGMAVGMVASILLTAALGPHTSLF